MQEKDLLELNAWIAENVMSLKPTGYHGEGYPKGSFFLHPDGEVYELEKYSTERGPAMQVLEKCCLKQGNVGLAHGKRGGKDNWLAGNEIAETLPLAICKFSKQLFSK